MKLSLIILYSLILISSGVSQDSTWQYGYQFGANLSSFTGENPYGEQYSNFGLNLGFYFKYSLSNFSKLYAEIRYISKGGRWGCTWLPIPGCEKRVRNYDISYLQFPLYYSASLIRFEDSAELLSLQLGPFISYALSSNFSEKYEAPAGWTPSTEGKRFEDYVNQIDYGISLGAQLYHNKNHNIFLRFVIDVSVAPLFKEDFVPESEDSKNTIKSFIIFLGIET